MPFDSFESCKYKASNISVNLIWWEPLACVLPPQICPEAFCSVHNALLSVLRSEHKVWLTGCVAALCMVFSSLLDASHVKTCLCWAKRAGAHVAGIRFWQWDHLACQLRVKYFSTASPWFFTSGSTDVSLVPWPFTLGVRWSCEERRARREEEETCLCFMLCTWSSWRSVSMSLHLMGGTSRLEFEGWSRRFSVLTPALCPPPPLYRPAWPPLPPDSNAWGRDC